MTDDCMGCRVPGYSHAAYCPEGRVEDLRSRLASVERERDEIIAMAERREDALRSRLAEAEVLIAKGLAVVHDFLPNIGRCVLQDYQRMNEFCCEAAARAADSAPAQESESHE